MELLSVNTGRSRPTEHRGAGGRTGIFKEPVDGPVAVAAPGPKGVAGSGLAGDDVVNRKHHGGDDQAVYAYAREDLDAWERELGRELPAGMFGENLTTRGLDVTHALIGERWRIGPRLLLEVTSARIPCMTFQGKLGEPGWIKRFTQAGAPGAYLRVIEPGEIRRGDPITVEHRPDHDVTVALTFRAMTTERALLPRLLEAGEALHPELRDGALKYIRAQEA
ncbi:MULTISPECIES: MOSC domain-containing protein [Streptomyces]|uniref:MOSC domain-containing protein n=1 Tax=Streptomyces rimosus subsp. rimosus (strain ATCC 10970 / DSM 40260 / JCM 4667 / NRRL 2234) TaxID=1265868 RepID=A0A8A1UM33_STRR1|nr:MULTISPECIES: MOSC domain-containing protein [Streptomyces]KOG68383.1 sulfurase [Kitasatospora aureofaciens]MYT40891.1 MOSC domain-containing protein [Streptomyces sp. SID5471]KEF02486.1 sulfurase [Streptomyces rimosus]KEF19804.1 sulfurase [Streptomyces rimosus]KOT27444.1 sulfurase [Streptomyces sp. NRRL WC-3701]